VSENCQRKRLLSQQDLRTLGAAPGRLITRYPPDGKRAEIRRLTSESSRRSPFLQSGSNNCSSNNRSSSNCLTSSEGGTLETRYRGLPQDLDQLTAEERSK